LINLFFALFLAAQAPAPLLRTLQLQAPRINPNALATAVSAVDCACRIGAAKPSSRLTVIDYSLPSTEPRIWVFDLDRRKLLFEELVAHGKNSGDNVPERFSNRPGSLMSSLGLFLTGTTYEGHNGYSLRLEGLEPGINDRSEERAIVMHGASYVSQQIAARNGRLGRSWGCPAVRPQISRPLIDAIKDGSFLFAYYPNSAWSTKSKFGHCSAPPARARAATPIAGATSS